MTDRTSFDVLVIGAGPAGLAAARAASAGRRVGLIDDNPLPGGQIWRGGRAAASDRQAVRLLTSIEHGGIERLTSAAIVSAPAPGCLVAETLAGPTMLHYEKLVLATGARELWLPFPGWTLPGVFGAGGLQALVKGGLPIAGKRVVVAGSGPLLLAVAAYLKRAGGRVSLIAEQASAGSVRRFALRLALSAGKLAQAVRLRARLAGVPYLMDSWPTSVAETSTGLRVSLQVKGRMRVEECDYLACGFGLVPNIELPRLLGCQVDDGLVVVNRFQETTVANVYAAGEVTGVGGLDKALAEGRVAGAAAARLDIARGELRSRDAALRFAARLEMAFALRAELRGLASPDTIVCRCEDVPLARLVGRRSWRDAKLQTRCGMGPCQGRVCGAATRFLFGWQVDSSRPPVLPADLAALACPAPTAS
jgi:D-hydroxyproline dehydrogenase subunit alpha